MAKALSHLSRRLVPMLVAAAALAATTGAVLAPWAGTAGAVRPRAAAATPPWEPDPSSVGGLTFYNDSGQQITGGNVDASPLAAYVEGSDVVRAGDTKATLFGYLPVSGEAPGQWSGEALSDSTAYPNAGAPSPLDSASLPLVTGAPGDETVSELEADFPNNDQSSDGYAGMYVLRLKTSAANRPANTTYDSADIEVSGDTWSVVYPYSASPTTTSVQVDPTVAAEGTSVDFSAEVTGQSGTPTGMVTFAIGSTTLCTTEPLVGGDGSCSASNAPVGSDAVVATYSGDAENASSSGTTTLVVTSGPYTPLPPVRICDTRAGNPSGLSGPSAQCNGINNGGSAIAAGNAKSINVANEDLSFGVPADATAVVLNVTAINPAAQGYLSVYPTGAAQPVASNLNYRAGETIPNLVEVGTGTDGDVSIFSLAETDVAIDVEGYTSGVAGGGAGAGLYAPLASPVRICDTRAGNPSGLVPPDSQCNGDTLSAGGSIAVAVAGQNGIPADATAAVFNVTVVGPASKGYLTVYPRGGSAPVVSNLNYVAGQTTSNRVIVPLSGGATPGYISVLASARADVLVDVSGYFSAAGGTGAAFTAEPAPVRICDTRDGNPSGLSGGPAQCNGSPIGATSIAKVQVTGLAGVPADASAVVVDLTGIAPTAQTYLSVFPNSQPSPPVSDLNEVPGEVKANMVVATLSASGTISVYNNAGTENIAIDVLGWYS